jgi:peptidoglycan/LPS O-acetylase OafA/YrhL
MEAKWVVSLVYTESIECCKTGFPEGSRMGSVRWSFWMNKNGGLATGKFLAPRLPNRIASLDGLRAVSILLVIVGHSADSLNAPQFLIHFIHFGNLGVRCFFIISGFLITTLLLKEWEKTGGISMKGFYARRALRIFPPSMAYIGIIAACYALGWLTLKPGDLIHALTYTMNYRYNPAHWFRHLWSLAVEEQFYLLWPGLLWLAGTRRGMKVAWSVVLIDPVVRAIMWYFFQASDSAMTKHFEAIADTLAIGCLLSMNFNRLGASNWYRRFQSSWLFWAIALGLALGGNVLFLVSQASFYILGQSITNLGIVLCIDWCIRNSDRGVGRLLNWRPIAYIGILSYSLYLWQNAFLNPDWDTWPARLPLNILFAFVMAFVSYYFVEQPVLKLRRRMHV